VKAGLQETEREPSLSAGYLIGPLSTIDPHLRWPSFTAFPAAGWPVVIALLADYLSTRTSYRNAAGITFRYPGEPQTMTTFDKREEAFEKQFVIDEELRFKAEARRNKLLGLWAADKLGLAGADANAYAKDVVAAEFEGAGDADVVRKVLRDLAAKDISVSEEDVRARMDEMMAQAVAQVKAGH